MTGQKLFTKGDKESLAVMDKQIFRIIGKATTLAAYVDVILNGSSRVDLQCFFPRMAYRVRQGREFVTPPTGLSYTGSSVFNYVHSNAIDNLYSTSYIVSST